MLAFACLPRLFIFSNYLYASAIQILRGLAKWQTPWLQQKLTLTAVCYSADWSGESCVLSVGIAYLTNNNAMLAQQQQLQVNDKQIWAAAWN